MSNDSTTDIPDQLHDHDAVVDNLMCLTCGYNLRGLSRKSHCPECGSKIVDTIIARQGMTKRELAALAFKVSALWSFLIILGDLIRFLRFTSGARFEFLILLLAYAHVIGLLVFLWWKSELLAKFTIKSDGPLSLSGRFITHDILSVAMGIIGVLYVIYGVTGVMGAMTLILTDLDNDYIVHSIINAATNLTLGLMVLFGATRIASGVLWLRTVGTKRDDRQP